MTKAIHILSKNLTGKENILIKETKSQAIKILDSYLFSQNIKNVNFNKISSILTNRVSQIVLTNNNYEKLLSNYGNFNWVIEIKFLPGVTDNIANTATEMIADNITSYKKNLTVGSSNIYLIKGNKDIAEKIAKKESNPLIHSIRIISYQNYLNDFKNNKFLLQDVNLPDKKYLKKDINLDIGDKQLSLIGRLGIEETDKSRRGTLGLDLLSMQSIKEYFNKIRRKPTDVEIETLAQTWSEHCKHKIFSAKIDELDDGIFKTFIKGATEKIIKQRKDNFCVSLFTDNAGAVEFNKDWLVCHKVETHNTPSALDPFGGSITGIVGVNRDCLGFGKGAKPIANTYAYYLANPNKKYNLYRQKNKKDPMLQASYIANGVISGVRVGGNCSGIPTPQGNIYFDDRFAGKPLVFCGTVGLIPKKINKKLSHIKKANHNDLIIMVGGRVGKDGIHGATFSSEELDPNSPVSAVQIGDPITQKKLSDVIIKELRDRDLYTSITDNGAGGLSSSIGEMAKESGGFIVNLEKIPLKYKGLYPWEIWISESQERMTLAVKPKNAKFVIKIFKQRGVEATIIGKFTKQKKAVVKYNRTVVLNLDMDFLHEGYPKLKLKTKKPTYPTIKKNKLKKYSLVNKLHKVLSSPNIVSKEFVANQYDHEVQASSIIKPLQGTGKVFGNATSIKPLFDVDKTISLSQSAFPQYSEVDPYKMAACSINTAVKNLVVMGANLKKIAILDNFCWCSSDDEGRLYELRKAAEACYDYAVTYKTPFISGKDSMYNDFKGFNQNNKPTKISIPPTLLISSIGIVDNINHLTKITPEKDDVIYVLGETHNELDKSQYESFFNVKKTNIPSVNAVKSLDLYQSFEKANKKKVFTSALGVDLGGIAVTLIKMSIGSNLGLNINIPKKNNLDMNQFLFSESQSRIVVSMKKNKENIFKKIFKNTSFTKIGTCIDNKEIIFNYSNKIYSDSIENFSKSYKSKIKGL